jgi:hypothetical protein
MQGYEQEQCQPPPQLPNLLDLPVLGPAGKSCNAAVRRPHRLAAEVAARSIRNSIIGQKTRTDTLTYVQVSHSSRHLFIVLGHHATRVKVRAPCRTAASTAYRLRRRGVAAPGVPANPRTQWLHAPSRENPQG